MLNLDKIYFVIEILGVHIHLSKCWRDTRSEKGWEPVLQRLLLSTTYVN